MTMLVAVLASRLAAIVAGAVCAYALASLAFVRITALRARARPLSVEDLVRDPLLGFVLFSSAALVVSWAVTLWMLPPCLVLAYVLSRKAPSFLDERRRRELRSACDGELDVLCDIVAMGTRAGLSFDGALELYCKKFDGPLAREMNAALVQWKSGLATREQALGSVAERTGSQALSRFSDMVLQAVRHGAPLADMLMRFSDDLREERAASIERQVEKAPVKMLLPMGVCILPAMLVLVTGPAILQFLEAGT